MSVKKSNDSFQNILKGIISIVFLFVFLIIAYATITSSRETRSKAAPAPTIYKSWEFNGTTTEWWTGTNLNGFTVKNGSLVGTATYRIASIYSRFAAVRLLQGKKSLIFRMSVRIPQTYQTSPTPTPTTGSTFQLKVSYVASGVQKEFPPIQGRINGGMVDYNMTFPEIEEMPITSLKLELSSIKTTTKVEFDYIRLTGTALPTPTIATPSPTSSCQSQITLASYSVRESCGTDLYRYVDYACSDGYKATQGGPTSCKSTSLWKQSAFDDCIRRPGNCPSTTPHMTPAPSLSKTPTPTWTSPTPTPTAVPYVTSTPTPTAVPTPYSCIFGTPTVTFDYQHQKAIAGTPLVYNITLLNNDGVTCPSTIFNLSSSLPSFEWIRVLDPTISIYPKTQRSFAITLTSPSGASAQTYTIYVYTNSGMSAYHSLSIPLTYTVIP